MRLVEKRQVKDKNIKNILLENGFLETIDGQYISASVIGRIIPDRKKGTADAKDKYGNRIAVLHWPREGLHG